MLPSSTVAEGALPAREDRRDKPRQDRQGETETDAVCRVGSLVPRSGTRALLPYVGGSGEEVGRCNVEGKLQCGSLEVTTDAFRKEII